MSDLVKRLRIKAGMIEMGEKIAWGSDTALMREAADEIERLAAPAVQGEPVAFCEDAALSLAERTFSSEVDEQLAEDVIQYARRLHDLYAAPQAAPDVSGLVAIAREIVDLHAKRKVVLTVHVEALEDALAAHRKQRPAPDVSALVDALGSALGSFDDWCDGQDPSDIADAMDTFPWVMQARTALSAHRKQRGE